MSKTIKIFDGVKVITSKGVKICRSPRDLWKMFGWDVKNDKTAQESATEITRSLLCFRRVDLSEYTENGGTLILEIIPSDNFCIMYREKGAKRWKHLDDIRRHEDEATEELSRILETSDRADLEFKIGRWD